MRVAILSTFTFEPLRAAIELQGLRSGLALDLRIGPFGQALQPLLDPVSDVASGTDAVILAIRLRDMCPAIYEQFNQLTAAQARQIVDDWLSQIEGAIRSFRRRQAARILVQGCDMPASLALGLADRSAESSQADVVRRAQDGLERIAGSIENVYVMDYDGLVAAHGRRTWADARMKYYARIPVAPAHYWALAGFYVRYLRALFGLSKKVLVLDADNTLWGGEVGESGVHGIAIGPDYPGNAFLAFQQRVLDLYHRGVVLCIASKNEPGVVQEVLTRHPDMLLKSEHFAAIHANWEPKPQSLRKIAEDLNLGLDSFVFIDDSPVECRLMRTTLPQVMTIQAPAEPAELPGLLESLDWFDQLHISAEDRRRGELYRAEAGRRALGAESVDLPSFYRQLEMQLSIAVDDAAQVARVAQLTNRTNQFNMNTVRCSEDDIRRFMKSPEHHVATVALADRFGDNGIVGAAIIRKQPAVWTLHMLLMSCRVLGRTVEESLVRWIAGTARKAGAAELAGEFVATARNKPFEGFYASCGFVPSGGVDGVQVWRLTIDESAITIPDWMTVQAAGACGCAP